MRDVPEGGVMADLSGIVVRARLVEISETAVLCELTWPDGTVTLTGFLLEPREPWQDGSGGWEGEDGG